MTRSPIELSWTAKNRIRLRGTNHIFVEVSKKKLGKTEKQVSDRPDRSISFEKKLNYLIGNEMKAVFNRNIQINLA